MRTFVSIWPWQVASKWVVSRGGKRVTVHYKASGSLPELTMTRLQDLLEWRRQGLVKEKRRKRKEKQ